MYLVKFYYRNRIVEEKKFTSFDEAQEAAMENDTYENTTRYKIIEVNTGEEMEAEEYPSQESIRAAMFPNGEDDD